jgi:metal-sulfur cluster biosynthetic enzyme
MTMEAQNPPAPSVSETEIRESLREVIDPELGCNIVDLGLIYGVHIEGKRIIIDMTLTTPGCPMHESIAWGVQAALLRMNGVEEVEVRLVWDPPWTTALMSESGRAQLGVYDT